MFRDVIKTLCGETMCCRPPAGGCGFDSCWTYKNIKCGCFSYCLYIHVVTILCSLTVVMFLHLVERKYKGEAGTEQCLLFTDYYWCSVSSAPLGPDRTVMWWMVPELLFPVWFSWALKHFQRPLYFHPLCCRPSDSWLLVCMSLYTVDIYIYIYINTVYTLCVTVYLWDSAKLGRSKINRQNEQAVNQNNPSCCSVGCCECTVALRGHTATQRSAVSSLEKKFNYYNMNEVITQTQKWINKLLSEEDEVPEHC